MAIRLSSKWTARIVGLNNGMNIDFLKTSSDIASAQEGFCTLIPLVYQLLDEVLS